MENRLSELLEAEIKKEDAALIVVLRSNPKATIYSNEVYWFNTMEDFVSDMDEQEFNSRFCESEKEAYAYGFEAVKKAVNEYPKIRIGVFEFGSIKESFSVKKT